MLRPGHTIETTAKCKITRNEQHLIGYAYYDMSFSGKPNCCWRLGGEPGNKVRMGVDLGERLRSRARQLGLSDAEVARRLGLSQPRYAHYVSGTREPDYATFARICRALAISPNEALGFEATADRIDEINHLRQRVQAAVESMDAPTLRTAAALLDVLASMPGEQANE